MLLRNLWLIRMAKVRGIFLDRCYLGGGFKYFYVHHHLGKIRILTNIVQRV